MIILLNGRLRPGLGYSLEVIWLAFTSTSLPRIAFRANGLVTVCQAQDAGFATWVFTSEILSRALAFVAPPLWTVYIR